MLNRKAKNDDIFLHSRKMNACFSLSPSPLSGTKNGEKGKTHRFSPTKFLFRPMFAKFQGKKKKFQGKEFEKLPTKSRKRAVTFSKRPVVFSKTSASFEKTTDNRAKPPKFTIFKTAENRVFPNYFFFVRISALNGGVENVNKSQEPRFPPPNRSLDSEQNSLVC